jgi:hypothetical protein
MRTATNHTQRTSAISRIIAFLSGAVSSFFMRSTALMFCATAASTACACAHAHVHAHGTTAQQGGSKHSVRQCIACRE